MKMTILEQLNVELERGKAEIEALSLEARQLSSASACSKRTLVGLQELAKRTRAASERLQAQVRTILQEKSSYLH